MLVYAHDPLAAPGCLPTTCIDGNRPLVGEENVDADHCGMAHAHWGAENARWKPPIRHCD